MTFPTTLFSGQRFAVVGLGRNGLPAVQALHAMGAEVAAWDDREEARAAASAAGITVCEPEMRGLTALVLSPGIPHTLPRPHPIAARAIAARVPVLSDAELLYRAVLAAGSRARCAGITGTNGKSTTTALLAHVLKVAGWPVAAGGNLGTPALALPLLPDDGIYVLEMSSYMLERIATLRFDAAVMLNLSADHIDRHGDMAGYARAKRAIFDRQTGNDLAVIGIDDERSREMAGWLHTRPAAVVEISERDQVPGIGKARALPGSHNAQNAAAASVMAAFLGVPSKKIIEGIETYPGLPHRQERVAEIDGIVFVNDSKATNADSAARALGCYDRLIWIAGGMAKEGGIRPLAGYFPRIALALLIGRDAGILAETLAAHGVAHRIAGTLDAAVAQAWDAARAGTANVVLLSPACASWDQFAGFDQRGDVFRALARQLARERVA
jgi:UDP-N-acetylmuramoylalanine--D-glutamate ligase